MCLEDNKAAKLESEDGFGLSPSDIEIGRIVIWKYRGAPYEAEYGKGKVYLKYVIKKKMFSINIIWSTHQKGSK